MFPLHQWIPQDHFLAKRGKAIFAVPTRPLVPRNAAFASGDDTKKSCCVLSFQNCGYHMLSHVITCHHRLMIGPWEIWSSYIFRTWLAEHQMKMMIGMINILETKIGDVFQPAAWHLSGIVSGQHWNLRKGQWAPSTHRVWSLMAPAGPMPRRLGGAASQVLPREMSASPSGGGAVWWRDGQLGERQAAAGSTGWIHLDRSGWPRLGPRDHVGHVVRKDPCSWHQINHDSSIMFRYV